MKDISFDPLFERFSGNIYGSRKGDIRLALLTEYLNQQSLVCNGRRVADVGGGLGQFTRYFAERDAIVDYFDLSGRMCSHVTDQLIPDFPQQIKVHQGYFQEQLSQSYDIIFCNAVLEWLENPHQALQLLKQHLKPEGTLVVSFYNRTALQLLNLVKGNFRQASRPDQSGDGRSLTPVSPLYSEDMENWVHQLGGQIIDRAGIRSFSEYMFPGRREHLTTDDVIDMELSVWRKQPYQSMSRYIIWTVCFV